MNCTVIKTGATVTKTASERVEELKSLIDAIEIPAIPSVDAKAGDICFYNVAQGKISVVDYDTWAENTSAYPIESYIPVGVVAIPTSHDVYGTGEGAMISLKYMNYSDPDNGSTSSQTIYWGEYDTDTDLTNLNVVVGTGTKTNPTVEASGTTSYNYLPSDNFSSTVCPTDPEAYYNNTSTTANSAAPSPYLEDGSRNPVYYQTESPSSELNCLADFNGVSNTEYLISLATGQSGWQTASSITNNSGAGYTPAACCCWRYHTDGTSQGDWYLPAAGELGYMMVRLKTINNTIQALIDTYGSDVAGTISTSSYLWSSSEYSSTLARAVNASNGTVNGVNKSYNDGYVVRAFARV